MVFTWVGDRWTHAVQLANGRRWHSTEGSASLGCDPRWPPSPPLTEVSLVEVGSRGALLGVGLAGRSHFSLSVVACSLRGDTLLFEVACRIHEPAGWLGSTYHGDNGPICLEAGFSPSPPATLSWAYRIGPEGIAAVPTTPVPASR